MVLIMRNLKKLEINKMNETELINTNFGIEEGSFLDELRNNSTFDRSRYNEFVFAVVKKSSGLMDDIERLSLAIRVWQISYLIHNSLYYDMDPKDTFSIEGINEEEKNKVVQDLYLISNSFSFNKELYASEFFL